MLLKASQGEKSVSLEPHGGFGGADSLLFYLTHALATTVKVRD